MSVNSIRVLRWFYSCRDETLTCELRLADDGLTYQVTTTPGSKPAAETVERFKDVTAAFQRQCELERKLIESGWSLESYVSQVRAADDQTAGEPSGTNPG